MAGMHRDTGKALAGIDHLRQSIMDILTTPLGSRVMRRDYGSRLYQLVDAPVNRALLVDIYAATAEALMQWERRLQLQRVQIEQITAGQITLGLSGLYVPEDIPVSLEGLII